MALLRCQANSSVRLLKNLLPTGKIKVYLAFSGHKQEVIQSCGWGRWEIRQARALASWGEMVIRVRGSRLLFAHLNSCS